MTVELDNSIEVMEWVGDVATRVPPFEEMVSPNDNIAKSKEFSNVMEAIRKDLHLWTNKGVSPHDPNPDYEVVVLNLNANSAFTYLLSLGLSERDAAYALISIA